MKIFVAGIFTETNTFSPIPTALEDFHVLRGTDGCARGGGGLSDARSFGDVEGGRKLGSHLVETGFHGIKMGARYECYSSLETIGEYLAIQLKGQGHTRSADTFRAGVDVLMDYWRKRGFPQSDPKELGNESTGFLAC